MHNKYVEHNDYVEVILPRRKGGVILTLIDHDSLEEMMNTDVKWYAAYDLKVKNYYVIGFSNGKQIKMHRFITKCPSGLVVDHINRNTLDNRKENLRNISTAENARNTKVYKNNKTGIKGVSYRENQKLFIASLKVNRKQIHIGHYKTLEEAEKAITKARLDLFGGEF
jgi:hypothetical protein